MKAQGLLILLLAVFLGVYADVNTGAVNNILRVIASEVAQKHAGGSFFASALIFYYDIPGWITTAAAALSRIAVCLAALRLRPETVRQGGGFILYRPLRVIGNGLLGYCAFMALILVFINSILGIPLALAILVIMWLMTLLGETALALAGGYLLLDSVNRQSNAYTYLAAGALLIEFLRCLPILGYAVGMFLLPVICMGIIVTLVYDGYLKKNYWETPFWGGDFPAKRGSLREIILKDRS